MSYLISYMLVGPSQMLLILSNMDLLHIFTVVATERPPMRSYGAVWVAKNPQPCVDLVNLNMAASACCPQDSRNIWIETHFSVVKHIFYMAEVVFWMQRHRGTRQTTVREGPKSCWSLYRGGLMQLLNSIQRHNAQPSCEEDQVEGNIIRWMIPAVRSFTLLYDMSWYIPNIYHQYDLERYFSGYLTQDVVYMVYQATPGIFNFFVFQMRWCSKGSRLRASMHHFYKVLCCTFEGVCVNKHIQRGKKEQDGGGRGG